MWLVLGYGVVGVRVGVVGWCYSMVWFRKLMCVQKST